MMRQSIGLLLILSGSTEKVALLGPIGCKTLIGVGILLIAMEYIAVARRRWFSHPASAT